MSTGTGPAPRSDAGNSLFHHVRSVVWYVDKTLRWYLPNNGPRFAWSYFWSSRRYW